MSYNKYKGREYTGIPLSDDSGSYMEKDFEANENNIDDLVMEYSGSFSLADLRIMYKQATGLPPLRSKKPVFLHPVYAKTLEHVLRDILNLYGEFPETVKSYFEKASHIIKK